MGKKLVKSKGGIKKKALKPGTRPLGALKKSVPIKVNVTPKHKLAIDQYCKDRNIPVAYLIYHTLIQIIPDPDR